MTDALAVPFFEASQAKRLVIQSCVVCRHAQLPPMARCEVCNGTNFEWIDADGGGVVASFVLMQRSPPSHAERVPYVYALIDLDEGPRIISNVITDRPSELEIGRRVMVTFQRTDENGQPWPEFLVED